MATQQDKPPVKLLGEDGNAFSIMGRCARAMRAAGWDEARRKEVLAEMQAAGDYDHLLQTAMKYFEVT